MNIYILSHIISYYTLVARYMMVSCFTMVDQWFKVGFIGNLGLVSSIIGIVFYRNNIVKCFVKIPKINFNSNKKICIQSFIEVKQIFFGNSYSFSYIDVFKSVPNGIV